MSTDRPADLLGLAGDFPMPGWVVLDAARGTLFTGELLLDLNPPVAVHLDRGEIYLAERSTEPPLGARLMDAGALNEEQLEHGSMRVADALHLGRLFERVPSVDREFVMLVTEMMNDECVAWLAVQDVAGVLVTPYRHHPSGIHRWTRSLAFEDLQPGDPLPAPPPTAAPVAFKAPPVPQPDTDPIVAWGGSATDAPVAAPPPVPASPAPTPDPALDPPQPGDSILESDWADRLETHGLPDADSDPLAVPTALPPLPTGHTDRFELIWPSGEIDEHFDARAGVELESEHEPDHDRAGPTARVVRSADVGGPDTGDDDSVELWDFENSGPSYAPIEERPLAEASPLSPGGDAPDGDVQLTVITDDDVLSMRHAVETIEAETMGAHATHTCDSTTTDAIRDGQLVLPGRVATRTESSMWNIRGSENSTNRSVFDETVPSPAAERATSATAFEPAAVTQLVPASAADGSSAEPARVSALRRLIGGLRRR